MRTRVKICGITRQQDAQAVAASGADALGLVFYPDSSRYIELEAARGIALSVAPFVTVTGLFVDAAPATIETTLEHVPLGLLQFHGRESNAACRAWGMPFIKSVAMQANTDLLTVMEAYPDAAGFLLDAWQPQIHGGGGETFDWDFIPARIERPLILAGGLTPDNVTEAIRHVRPYGVDVSSGVESAPGIKSAAKISDFMTGVESGEADV
ncbi:MAG: phosphoribosylanthranilate isomerase [Gammaproteobacteria bacterium]